MDPPPSKRRTINTESLTTQQGSSSSSFASTHPWTYDVFLSFRGEDTRYNFTDHLHKSLVQNWINTFRDDDALPRGEEISQALLQAIEGSKSSLIVFSENYASSKWCLDELVHILESKRSNQQQKVWPVFYKVDPSDVRRQTGSFGDALAKLESKYKDNMDKLKWRKSLTEAASLSGWHFSNGYESKFIDEIVEYISSQVKELVYLNMPKCSIGLDSRVQDMLERLDVGGKDIRMVGIWGIGGIGKTIIAKAVYNSIAHKFKCRCFLANVREESEVHGGLLNLQKILLSTIVKSKELNVNYVDEGTTLLRERLRYKKILLVLDDVNNLNQLERLAGASNWFGRGSRIIITTRDKHLLIIHDVDPIYTVKKLDPPEARELFISKAFKNKTDLDDDEKLAVSSVVEYAQGLPLALVVLGSCLCGPSIHKWQIILDGYKRSPPQDIQKILKISYDALEDREKKVFLDIACFFKGWCTDDVIPILKSCDHINTEHTIQVLEQKALINVEYSKICLHDLLEEMGKEIVHQESPNEPGKRSRLWYHKDVLDVLTENTGTSKIEGIMVKLPTTDEIRLSSKCFKKMKNLKFFINVNAQFCGKVDYLSKQLRVLDWRGYPLQSLPSNFDMKKLVHLNMPCSLISHVGKGFKHLENLKSMNFSKCKFLTKIPDLSGCPNLECLDLWGCKSLVKVHRSVGFLEKLVHLCLGHCCNLVKLPRKVNWRSLEDLHLYSCRSLESFPEIVGEMKCLTKLNLWDCSSIKELPLSIGYLINLQCLSISKCENLTNLPCSIYQLQELNTIDLYECPKLVTFLNMGNSAVLMPTGSEKDREFNIRLKEFEVSPCNSLSDSDMTDFPETRDCASTLDKICFGGKNIVSLPEGLCKFIRLRELDLHGCWNLVEIPQLPPCIKLLDVRDCVSLERISKLSKILEREESQMIEEMNFTNCWRLIKELVKEANVVVNDDYEAVEALFSLFLCSQQSKFTVRFPGSEIPKWFTFQMDLSGLRHYEFFIEILPNFKWQNTGLALSVLKLQNKYITGCSFQVFIYINDVRVLYSLPVDIPTEGSDHVWLQYIPFHEMWRPGYMRPLPPFMCRVIVYPVGSLELILENLNRCGVHLVMPPNEDVCMKLSRVENLTGVLPKDSDEDF